MIYAIVETSGTQLRVEPGRFYDVNRLAFDEDDSVTLDKVLYVSNNGDSLVGQPLVEGATVSATVMRHLRGRKVIVYKMQPKKKTRKKRGHRQELTRIMIDGISLNGEPLADDSAADTPAEAPAAQESSAPEAVSTEASAETATAAPTPTADEPAAPATSAEPATAASEEE